MEPNQTQSSQDETEQSAPSQLQYDPRTTLSIRPGEPGAPLSTRGNTDLMGPILRRKKVVSMPLGAGGDFFVSPHGLGLHDNVEVVGDPVKRRIKQRSVGFPVHEIATQIELTNSEIPTQPLRIKQNSGGAFVKRIVRRKQVSLDLLGPNDFFVTPEELQPLGEAVEKVDTEAPGDEVSPETTLFRPLRFSRPRVARGGRPAHGGHAVAPSALSEVDAEKIEFFDEYAKASDEISQQIQALHVAALKNGYESEFEKTTEKLQKTFMNLRDQEAAIKSKLSAVDENAAVNVEGEAKDGVPSSQDTCHEGIIKAKRSDKIQAMVVFCIMLAVTLVVTLWPTHQTEELYLFAPVGIACSTFCNGTLEENDFFHGHNHFEAGDVIELVMHLDYFPLHEALAIAQIIGNETGEVKATVEFGPADHHERLTFYELVPVDFPNPEEAHYIDVSSSTGDVLTFTLTAHTLTPLANYSVAVAAVIMVLVYVFILLEVIHRTLVAIFGSMVALMFFFIMTGGNVVSIQQIMLHLEWSTLGLLFGMMLLVGELSHTGIFEWCAVRLLVSSKGSFVRLVLLLCSLTAVASAFLDNVTTMLLIAPVTIDMCNILEVDPRPYLIGEVLLSNIGGTATLIGDPPNIIIGSSFSEIGFIDFIINVFPCIFFLCIPIALALIVWVYRYYFTSSKMRVLDVDQLKRTYPIYDEPRLLIAGTSTFFVILMFFLHSVHHKDTAWIALLGAFITIAFTNPRDVQDALRNHVEWDTLLFFAGLFVLVEVCAEMGLLNAIGDALASYISAQPEEDQLAVAITLIIWVSAIASAFLDNIPYTATMIPVIQILANSLDTLPITTLAWALSFGACLGGNGTLLGASANIVTAGISTNKGFEISFLNFLYPGMLTLFSTVAVSNLYMLVVYVWMK